jgi:hypothetical protein
MEMPSNQQSSSIPIHPAILAITATNSSNSEQKNGGNQLGGGNQRQLLEQQNEWPRRNGPKMENGSNGNEQVKTRHL